MRFLACESCRNALSEASSGVVVGADFPFVFRDAWSKRIDVPGKLRLALPRDFQPALATRQSQPLLAASLRNVGRGFVNATARGIPTTAFRNSLATGGTPD